MEAMLVEGWEDKVARVAAMSPGERIDEFRANGVAGGIPAPASGFDSVINVSCVGCRHRVSFEAEAQKVRFLLSSGWKESGVGYVCPIHRR